MTAFCVRVAAQTPATETEVWPEVDAHVQLPAHFRALAIAGLQQAVNYPYQQWYVSAGLGYQLKPILKPHLKNIDQDKEHHLVFGGGYEYLQTVQSGKTKYENRLALEGTFGFRLPAGFLVRDRNRVEFRWVDGVYSTRYRNQLRVERDFLVHGFRFAPYGSAEVYYDGAKNSWNEQEYAAGVQWPYKHLWMLETYYLRQNCTTCNPAYLNVAGFTLNFYFRNPK
jgi:hypothetical protein